MASELTPGREQEIRGRWLLCNRNAPHRFIVNDLLAEIDRLREETALLVETVWEQTDKALRLFDQCEPLRLENETLRHRLAKAREALTTYRELHDEGNGDRPCLCGACQLARAVLDRGTIR